MLSSLLGILNTAMTIFLEFQRDQRERAKHKIKKTVKNLTDSQVANRLKSMYKNKKGSK